MGLPEVAKVRGAGGDGFLALGLGSGRAAAIAGLHRLGLPSSEKSGARTGGRADVPSLFSISEHPYDLSRKFLIFVIAPLLKSRINGA
ncbi:MAG: hypothetical protein ABSC25_08575 [Roseiarcus sp.]